MSSPCGCKTTGHEPDCWMLRQTNLVEPPSEATWRGLPQSRHEGFWFTVDSLADIVERHVLPDDYYRVEPDTPFGPEETWFDAGAFATAILKAAKEASDE